MAHAIWNGSINFGLVTIPVRLFTAVRENEIHFNMLHKTDKGRINFQRVCSVDGKKVDWKDIVKGYEVGDGEYVIISDEDIKKVRIEATQSIDITEFVKLSEINPILFDKPYYLEPEKKGRHAYALLRDALAESGKVGIARVVIRTKEYICALKPNGNALVLELMHYPDEIVDVSEYDFPPAKEKVSAAEMKAAKMLIDTMEAKFNPDEYRDRYRDAMMTMIEARAKGKPVKTMAAGKPKPATEVVNLMDVLQESLKRGAVRKRPAHANGKSGSNGKAKKRVAARA
ncbi:MAG: Ku protein [Candidatus Eremiobacteraeota bacterium]|nr:Ku protein [Candidatus Eremiobacteraeota bacterium]MBV8365588.1 Ku protein [Candidatus Eremiobacteraeota bacterium]